MTGEINHAADIAHQEYALLLRVAFFFLLQLRVTNKTEHSYVEPFRVHKLSGTLFYVQLYS